MHTAEDRFEDKVEQITDKAGRLLLAEEDWLEKHKHRFQQLGSSVKKENGGADGQGKGKSVAHQEPQKGGVKLTSEGTPRSKGRCWNCGIYGHWAQDCKRPKKEKREEANLAKADVDQATLLLASVHDIGLKQP